MADGLPASPSVEGCILSNELLDALPFHRVRVRDGRLYELRVAVEADRFVDVEAAAGPELYAYFDALGFEPGEGCAEVCLAAPLWMASAASALRHGYVLTLDYGYEASELFSSSRRRGTLLSFYRHTADDDPYVRIGRQDITASVDFTTLQRAGEAAGLRTLTLTTQADWLTTLGIGEAVASGPDKNGLGAFQALRKAVIELTDPGGLGRIRVLIQDKDVPERLPSEV
jgi:SAM-dependent MidA family methyltransferase